jgi:meso-butanediol dehydrogenase / (S,S)-butanediol dehydrogenase / diacetyl reductase
MGTLLAGKTVIVTGASRGIGLATALHLHDEDAQVVATVRSPEHLTQLKVDDDRLIGRVVDVTDETQVKDLISFTVERFGKLDGIVNNAGILIPGTILDATVEDY